MHCILVHLFRGKAVPQVSILISEVWNRKFRNLGFEIPKLWIPKTAQDCCEKVNGTLDWGIPKSLIASWIPKIEQFQKPLLPNKCLLIGSHSQLCCVICMLIAPVSVKACEIPLQSQSPTFQCLTEYSFHNGPQKTQSWLFPSICKDRFTTVLSACLFSAPCFAPFKWPHHFKWPCVRDWSIKKRPLQESEGNFPSKVPGEFWGEFLVDFFGPFSLNKKQAKKFPKKKSTAKLKSEFGSFAARIHTARLWPWYLASN